jgi:hypothetical protein
MKQRLKPPQPVMVPRASDWVPPEKRDPAWYLFNQLFHCRVQRIQTLSLEEMKEYGTPTSGDPEYDAQMRNERQDRMLTIAKMVEYWDNGITVGVVAEADTKRIYDYISNHLIAWKYKLEHELNNRGAPLEDLIKLDKFANSVYRHAKYHLPDDYVESILHKSIRGARMHRANIMKPFQAQPSTINGQVEEPKSRQEELDEKYPNRVSMADAFKRGQSNGGVTGGVGVPRWRNNT